MGPVRAGLCSYPEEWCWSRAKAHVEGGDDGLVNVALVSDQQLDWSAFLASGLDGSRYETIRKHERNGRPLGSDEFVSLATTLAHIAWVQVLSENHSLPINADVDSLFERALRADSTRKIFMPIQWVGTGCYVSVIFCWWMLKFDLALQGGLAKVFVRRLQMGHLTLALSSSG